MRLEAIHQQYQDRVPFFWIYIREAHASDEWALALNVAEQIVYAQPTTNHERAQVAEKCAIALPITMPILLDGVDDAVGDAYAAYPDRLYVIDAEGRVAHRGGPGPWGFDVDGWEAVVAEVAR